MRTLVPARCMSQWRVRSLKGLSMKKLLVLIMILCCATLSHAEDEIKITGTYSNLVYNQEAGDLLGDEVRIVIGRTEYEGTFQTSLGEPDTLVLLKNIEVKGNTIKFSIPPGSIRSGEFAGELTKTGLAGILTLKNGNKLHVELKRGTSYWD